MIFHFAHTASNLEQVFKVSNKLGNVSAFSLIRNENPPKSLDEHVSHTAPALEALLSTYLIGGFALSREHGFPYVATLFPHIVAVATRPREANSAYKKVMLFWPIDFDFGWGHPDKFRIELVVDRFEKSERIKSLFGGTASIKSAVLQLACYVEWNSFLYVARPVLPQITAYMQRSCDYCPGTIFDNNPHFVLENTGQIVSVVNALWNLARSPALNHLSGLALDSNITQRLVDLGPEPRKELVAGFVLYAQQLRAQTCLQSGKASEYFSWSEDLMEAVKALRQRRESGRTV